MLSAAVLQPGSALACLPQNCRQSLSQLPSFATWTVKLVHKKQVRAAATAAQSLTHEAAVSAEVLAEAPQKMPAFISEIQGRHLGRLQSHILDKQGRIMLKNLTRAELTEWFELQGIIRTFSGHQPAF